MSFLIHQPTKHLQSAEPASAPRVPTPRKPPCPCCGSRCRIMQAGAGRTSVVHCAFPPVISFHPVTKRGGSTAPSSQTRHPGFREALTQARGCPASNDRARIQTHIESTDSTFCAFSPVTAGRRRERNTNSFSPPQPPVRARLLLPAVSGMQCVLLDHPPAFPGHGHPPPLATKEQSW